MANSVTSQWVVGVTCHLGLGSGEGPHRGMTVKPVLCDWEGPFEGCGACHFNAGEPTWSPYIPAILERAEGYVSVRRGRVIVTLALTAGILIERFGVWLAGLQ